MILYACHSSFRFCIIFSPLEHFTTSTLHHSRSFPLNRTLNSSLKRLLSFLSSIKAASQGGGCAAAPLAQALDMPFIDKYMGTAVDTQNMENGRKVTVIFVLGGPGSGKGTQCANIVQNFGFTHLSAGDLLRAEIKSGCENGTMIQSMIKEGKIVPSDVTVKLLQLAMQESGNDKFLIDGFPRNEENHETFESVTGIEPEFVLFFDCPEEEMEKRLLSRNQGREDDNLETIKKRFKVYMESSLPVVAYYSLKDKVRKIDAAKQAEAVFEDVKAIFNSTTEKQVASEDCLTLSNTKMP